MLNFEASVEMVNNESRKLKEQCFQDSTVWRSLAQRKVSESALADPYLLSELASYKKKLRAFYYAWNPNDVSKYVFNLFRLVDLN